MSEEPHEKDSDIAKYLLSLSAILNAIILETGITHGSAVYWLLFLSVPLLALTWHKATTATPLSRDHSL